MTNRNYKIDKARKLLGVSKQATAEDARNKYRELAKIWHPDVNSTEEAHKKMQDINKAYALLMKEEFGILDFWEEAERWWWRQFGNDPCWGGYCLDEEEGAERPRRRKKTDKKKVMNLEDKTLL
jgi:hypothetical protein